MEKYVKLYPTDSLINQFHAALAAHCYLMNKKKGIRREAWYRIRLDNVFTRRCYIDINAIDAKEDMTITKGCYKGLRFIRYEVKKNPWNIEYLEYRYRDGFFAIGEKLDLLREAPFIWPI